MASRNATVPAPTPLIAAPQQLHRALIFHLGKEKGAFCCVLCQGELLFPFGVPAERLEGARLDAAMPADAFARILPSLERAWQGETLALESPDATGQHTYLTILMPIRKQGQVAGLAGGVLDVTERRQTEQDLRNANEVLSQRSAELEHNHALVLKMMAEQRQTRETLESSHAEREKAGANAVPGLHLPARDEPPAHIKQARVLVVEDNAVNQKVAMRQLTKLGYIHATAVANGIETLSAVRRMPYDLILMDCQMPEMDGYETTRRLRALERERAGAVGAHAHTPIIALTANALAGDRERCLAAGMDDYLTKPVRIEQLERMLQTWLQRAVEASVRPMSHPAIAAKPDAPPRLASACFAPLVPDLARRAGPFRVNPTELDADILALFVEQMVAIIRDLPSAVEKADASAIRQHAHSLMGMGGTVGEPEISVVGEDLSTAAKSGDMARCRQLAAALAQWIAAFRRQPS